MKFLAIIVLVATLAVFAECQIFPGYSHLVPAGPTTLVGASGVVGPQGTSGPSGTVTGNGAVGPSGEHSAGFIGAPAIAAYSGLYPGYLGYGYGLAGLARGGYFL